VAVAPDTGPVPKLIDLPEPEVQQGEVLVEGLLVGVCATDRAVIEEASQLSDRIVLGHESLGRVVAAPEGAELANGDLVVGLIRRPCPEGCRSCLAGELDRCLTRPPVERGISRADGFAAELWTSLPDYLCQVPAALGEAGVLIEPASSIVKGLRRVRRGRPADFPTAALVIGGGTIGALVAAFLAVEGVAVDLSDPFAPQRRQLVEDLGGRFLTGPPAPGAYELVVEASGAPEGLDIALAAVGSLGHVLVLGLPHAPVAATVPATRLAMDEVEVTFSVNATRADHETAIALLGKIEPRLLARLMERELPLERYEEALVPGDSPKTVVRVAR